ncbi:hypothetical protein LMA04_00575 [Pseudescherichia vulneris]|uniref:hypothetical protein n=1 Tax=Pseudescherichia vulneris TaxID=566 RepID=UPI00227A013E|nr:hypothetical protein [Pseudescherichia vulneris]WAH52589.1 hypothetical protein LMA04_00575 [Pseudescherichia vulneris]
MSWLLIMTLIGTSGVSIQTADFATEAACLTAARKWQHDIQKITRDISAICTLKSGVGE